MDNRSDVRDFLVSRRARITPEKAGLPTFGGNRRVPGLRREEVAMLAGVSVDYYNRLERGALAGVSDAVLDSVARALQLDEAEHSHLFDLARAANTGPATRRRTTAQKVRPSIQRLLDAMTDAPAWVRNDRHDLLAANRLGYALYADMVASPLSRPTRRGSCSSTRRRSSSSRTGRRQPTTPSPSCDRRRAATPTIVTSATSSASCRRAARPSARDGPRTTCDSTAPGSSACTTPSSATSN